MTEEVSSSPQFIQNIKPEMPKILIINYDERREVIVSFLKRFTNKYIRKEKILSEIENMIKIQKPDIVAFFTQDSISGTKYHYQHQLMEKIEGIKNTELEYRIVSKVDATTKANSRFGLLESNDKKPFNVRTRIYVNNKTVYFGFSDENFSKSVNEGISNNSIYNEKESNNLTYNKTKEKKIFIFRKYGYRRMRFSRNGEGYILSNMTITNYNSDSFHKYIFCNYNTDNDIDVLQKMIMKRNIDTLNIDTLNINTSIYLITKNLIKNIELSKYSNKKNITYLNEISIEKNGSKVSKYKINGQRTLEFLKLNGSKFKNVKSIDKYLILISDIEGCSSPGQSIVLCSKEFFDSLDIFLFNGNSVAFLGDYFDKGDLVVNTINNIIRLYEKYNITLKGKGFGKVHIILGNRDLNKLRIPYEVQDDIVKPKNTSSIGLWPLWKDFYSIFTSNTSNKKKLVEDILDKSMGARGSYDWIKPLLVIKDPKHSKISFSENLRKLFMYGKIVIYDKDFKILLSHAGGVDIFLNFINLNTYYENIIDKLKVKISADIKNNQYKYFEYIEFCRKELMTFNINNNKIKNINDINDINDTKFINNISAVNSIFYNLRYKTNNFNLFSNETLSEEYFLIQAMGLKPDDQKPFFSFIDSRDHNGCSGPKIYEESIINQYKNSLNFLKKSGINFVASGHVPHCAPVPLIYRRAGCENVAFILNDTSNTYRKQNIDSVNKLPLSFVRSKRTNQNIEYLAGVGFLDDNKISTNLPSTGIPKSLDNFSFMIGEWNVDDTNTTKFPYFEGTLYNGLNSYVKYPSGELRFTTEKSNEPKNPFSPANGVKNNP